MFTLTFLRWRCNYNSTVKHTHTHTVLIRFVVQSLSFRPIRFVSVSLSCCRSQQTAFSVFACVCVCARICLYKIHIVCMCCIKKNDQEKNIVGNERSKRNLMLENRCLLFVKLCSTYKYVNAKIDDIFSHRQLKIVRNFSAPIGSEYRTKKQHTKVLKKKINTHVHSYTKKNYYIYTCIN